MGLPLTFLTDDSQVAVLGGGESPERKGSASESNFVRMLSIPLQSVEKCCMLELVSGIVGACHDCCQV